MHSPSIENSHHINVCGEKNQTLFTLDNWCVVVIIIHSSWCAVVSVTKMNKWMKTPKSSLTNVPLQQLCSISFRARMSQTHLHHAQPVNGNESQ